MKPVLLFIDLQNHFLNKNIKAFTRKIIPNTKQVFEISRKNKVPIIHVITKYKADKSDWPEAFKDWDKIWCLENEEETEIIEGLEPNKNEVCIIKKRFTAFYATDIDTIIKEMGIDTIFICGYSADGCIRYTTMDAYNRGYKMYWLKDCMDSAFEKFKKSLEHMKRLTRIIDISNREYEALINNS
jgi:nicotinamidase-related amidase